MTGIDARLLELEAVRSRWMAGGEAAVAGTLAQGHQGTEAQLRLLAEVGQARQICLRPDPPAGLVPLPPLPPAALPLLRADLRPLFRRLLEARPARADREALIGLLTARGVMAHPFDWLPPKDLGAYPGHYAALSAWAAGQTPTDPETILADATWDDFTPTTRLAALARLRQADPAAAQALLQARLAGQPAEERVRLVAVVATRLSDQDRSFLETLRSDRSAKVQAAARQLLARLGVAGDDEETTELAGFLETRTALLSRQVSLAPKSKLGTSQFRRMTELFGRVAVARLAAAFGMDEPRLAAAWSTDHAGMALALLSGFVLTGSDAGLRAYWARLGGQANETLLAEIAPRLTTDELLAEALDLLRRDRVGDPVALAQLLGPWMPDALGQALLASRPVGEILTAARVGGSGQDQCQSAQELERLVVGFGLVLPVASARALMTHVTGPTPALPDPTLDTLKLNIALDPSTRGLPP